MALPLASHSHNSWSFRAHARAENAKLLERREVLKNYAKRCWSRAVAITTGKSGGAILGRRERIHQEFIRSRQRYGSPRLAHALGCPGRRNRIARLMRQERLFARQRSKYRVAPTDSRHGGPIAPNRIQNLNVQRLDQVWVSDATGVLTAQGWLYLVAVLDVFSRRILGWAMSPILDASLTSAALRMALSQRRPTASIILHSDRGSQFASATYRQLLAQHRLVASMSRKGNCYDNAFIESFWSSLKYEWAISLQPHSSLHTARHNGYTALR